MFEDYNGGSLHTLIARKTGKKLKRVLSLITTLPAQADDAARLAIPPQHWVLRVKSVNVNAASGKPIEYAVTRFRADRVKLAVKIP